MDWTGYTMEIPHNENIFNFKNVVLFLRTFSTQMRTSEFSQWNHVFSTW